MLAPVAAVTMCFRCEWISAPGGPASCPRCGAALQRVGDPPRPRSATFPTPSEEHSAPLPPPARRSRGRAAAVVLGVVILLVAGSVVTDREVFRRSPVGATDPIAEELQPVLARSAHVAVPIGLAEAAGDAGDRVTFVTKHEVGLYRLWRLDLGAETVVPGPVVPRVREVQLAPGAEDRRLMYLADGGALFFLEGFHASRPQWLTGAVSAFDLGGRRAPLGASLQEVVAPWGAGSEVRLSVGRVSGGVRLARPSVLLTGAYADGSRVARSRAYVWGSRGDDPFLITLNPGSPRPREVKLGPDRVIDVSPEGDVLVAPPDDHPIIHRVDGSQVRVGMEIGRVTTWSPGGGWMVVRGGIEATGSVLWLVSATTGSIRPLGPLPATAGFSSDGRLVFWSEAGELAALDLITGRAFWVQLPRTFPPVVGPLVAG
jgi:hypothetical protein